MCVCVYVCVCVCACMCRLLNNYTCIYAYTYCLFGSFDNFMLTRLNL